MNNSTPGRSSSFYKFYRGLGPVVFSFFLLSVASAQPIIHNCPSDISVNQDPNRCGALVNYTVPTATGDTKNLPTSLHGYTFKGSFGGHHYFLSNNIATPEAAQAAATALGGHLATISTASENSFVSGFTPDRMWIGFTDKVVEGTFRWVTNEPVTYTNWYSGEPNNAFGNEDWGVMNAAFPGSGFWNDQGSWVELYYVVEFDGEIVNGPIPVNLISGLPTGAVFPVGTTTVTYQATDFYGTTTCSFTVKVKDNTPPVISCPSNIVVNSDANNCGAVVNYTVSATDNCGAPGNFPTFIPGYTYRGIFGGHAYFLSNNKVEPEAAHAAATALGGHLVTISNAAENSFVSSFIGDKIWIGFTDRDVESNFKWVTNEPVSYTNWHPGEPNNALGNEDWAVLNWVGNTWNDWFYYATAYYVVEFDVPIPSTGPVSTTLVSGLASGSTFPVGTTTVTYQATDVSNNTTTCSFTVTVDNVPIAKCKNATVALNATGTASVTTADLNDGSSGGCGIGGIALSGKTIYNCDDVGQSFPVTLTVTDISGNTSRCTAQVTVTDPNSYCNAPPVAKCKALTISAGNNCLGHALANAFDDGSYDPNGDPLTFTVSPAGPYPLGTTNVILTVTDSKGASSSCATAITVKDDQKPIISAPANVNTTTNNGCTATNVNLGTPATVDNCSVASVTNNAPASYPVGTTTVTWTVTDVNGLSSTATQTVTVVDNEMPSIASVSASPNILWPPNHQLMDVIVSSASSDNCGVSNCKVIKVTSNEADNGLGDGDTPNDIQQTGDNSLILRAERSSKGTGRVYTITIECTDVNGNKSTGITTVTVPKSQAPTTRVLTELEPSQNKTRLSMKVAPNPSTGRFVLQLNGYMPSKATVIVTNANGAVVQRRIVNITSMGQTKVFDLSHLASGMYTIMVMGDNGVQTQKLVVQK